jgi:3-phenylpropionate/trans-cinnamate dioxygenase ferredoxin subunit
MRFVRAGSIRAGELADGTVLRVDLEGEPVAIARVAGEVFVVSDSCTHEEASLAEGFLDGRVIECPRHGACFDLCDGRVLSLPAVKALRTYPVRIEDDAIWVGIEERAAASGGAS